MKTIIHTSLSRKRSHKSPRSSFMSKLMTLLGGDTGNDVANAFVKPDPEKFQELMGAVVTKMTESIKRSPPKVESSLQSESAGRAEIQEFDYNARDGSPLKRIKATNKNGEYSNIKQLSRSGTWSDKGTAGYGHILKDGLVKGYVVRVDNLSTKQLREAQAKLESLKA